MLLHWQNTIPMNCQVQGECPVLNLGLISHGPLNVFRDFSHPGSAQNGQVGEQKAANQNSYSAVLIEYLPAFAAQLSDRFHTRTPVQQGHAD